MKKLVLALFCSLLLTLPLAAEEWNLDPAHSKVRFTAEARFLSADGIFRKFQVKADVNEAELEKSAIDMVVDVASIDTNVGKRDDHLRSDAFFDVAHYPTAHIAVGQIRKLSTGNYEGDGQITIRGVTKPLRLPARILLMEGGRLRFRGTVEINRMDFGVSYNGAMNKIEDMVSITYELNLVKPRPPGQGPGQAPAPPAAKPPQN